MNFWTEHINQTGHLVIGGCDLVDLASQYGTPFYLLDEERLVSNINRYKQAFSKLPNCEIIYAGKALLTVGIIDLWRIKGFP